MDVISYALSKKIAAHVVSGIQSMSVNGQTLTINTKDSGVLTMTFPTPKDGVSVTDIDVNANNQIVFTMSDGSEFISGKIPTVKGEPGFSPTITENADNTDKIYKLDITTADKTFTTPNLKGADGQGGTGGSGEENTIDSISVNGVNVVPDENKNVDITVPNIYVGDTEPIDDNMEVWFNPNGESSSIDVPIEKIKVNGELQTPINKVVDITVPSIEGLAKTEDIPTNISELTNDSGYLTEHQDISGKVDKVEGKSLISDTEIARLATVDNYDDTDIRTELAKKADTTSIPSKVSELTNDSNYQTAEQVNSTVTTEIAKVVADAPESLNTLKEMSDWIAGHEDDASAMNSAISDNKTAITALQSGKADKSEIPTTVAELTDSADYAKKIDLHSHENKTVLDGITSTKVSNWDSAKTHADSAHAPSNAQENVLETVKVNGTALTPSNKAVNIDLSDYAKTTDIPTTLPADGGNADTVNNHTVETDVPTDAVFTDTTYSDATQIEHGLMSVDDKKKLDGLKKYTPDGTTITADEDGTLHGVAEVTVDDALSSTSTNPVQNKVVTNNLTDLKYGEVAGGKNLFNGKYIKELISFGADYTNRNLYDEFSSVNDITGLMYVTFGGYFRKGKYTLSYSNNVWLSFNRVAFAGTECTASQESIRKTYTWEQTQDGYTYFSIEADNRETGTVDVPFSITPNIQIEEGSLATSYEPYIPSVNMLAEENAQQSTEMMDIKMLGWAVPRECPIQNEVNGNQFIQKVGRVDLGSLEWHLRADGSFENELFTSLPVGTTPDEAKEYAIYSNLYKSSSWDAVVNSNAQDMVITLYKFYTWPYAAIAIRNKKYTEVDSFKQAMQGVYIYYELATPITKTIDGNEIGEAVSGVRKETTVNLLKPTLQTTTANGVTCTNNGDGTYTLNGTATSAVDLIVGEAETINGKQYLCNGTPVTLSDSSFSTTCIVIRTTDWKVVGKNGVVFTAESNKTEISIHVESGVTVSNVVFKPMLTTNLSATYDDFVPYTGDGETLASDVAEIKNDLGGLTFSASGTTLSITDGTHTWTLEANS